MWSLTKYLCLLLLVLSETINSFQMNVGSTGVLFSYSLGALAYIKHYMKPSNYSLLGISGGAWCSVLYQLEPNIDNHDLLWSILVGEKDTTLHLLHRKSMQQFQERVAKNFIQRYKDADVTNIPVSILTTRVSNRFRLQNIKIDKFTDVEDLVNYCLCSSYIPLISGNSLTKLYKNERYIDGEIRKNRKCFENCINSKVWGRKYSIRQRIYLDFEGSQKLFNDGWNDAKLYASSHLLK